MELLSNRGVLILTAVLAAQGAVFYGGSRKEVLPAHTALSEFPTTLRNWQMIQQGVVEKEIEDILKADDLLTRLYAKPGNRLPANLFVAFFESQRTGKSPHSPKNCLPGSGWVPSSSGILPIRVSGEDEPIRVNRYIVAKGDSKSVVLYWYQSHGRVVANEYRATMYVLVDAMRLNRTDTALVRVIVPIADDEEAAGKTAIDFVQAFFEPLRRFLPA